MQSSNARLISGAVVTFLLLALIALIIFTLSQTGESADPGAQAAATLATAQAALTETAAASTIPQPVTATPDPAVVVAPPEVAATLPLTNGVAGEVASGAALTETVAAGSTPAFAITIQPTPTRRLDGEVVGATVAATAPPTLPAGAPTVDPAAVPSEPLQVFADADAIADLTWFDGGLWTATAAGACRWDPASGESTSFGIGEGLVAVQLRAVVECPLPGLGLVFGGAGGLEIYDSESGEWLHVGVDNAADEGALPFADVTALDCNGEAGLLAVGSATDGIAMLNGAEGEWTALAADEEGINGLVRALAIADDGTLWVASGATISQVIDGEVSERFDSENSPLTGETVTALAADGETLWATAGDRLFRYADEEWSVFRVSQCRGRLPCRRTGRLATHRKRTRVDRLADGGDLSLRSPNVGLCALVRQSGGDGDIAAYFAGG